MSGEDEMSGAVEMVKVEYADSPQRSTAEPGPVTRLRTPQHLSRYKSATVNTLPTKSFPGLSGGNRRQSTPNNFGVTNSGSLNWESNKVEQIINETKSLLDDPGAVHDETRRFRHRSGHTITLVKKIQNLSPSQYEERNSKTSNKEEGAPIKKRSMSKAYSTEQIKIVPLSAVSRPPSLVKPCCKRGRISVESNFTVAWDFFMLFLLIYVVFVTPFFIAFEELLIAGFDELLTSPYVYVDIMIDFLFAVDLLLNFLTTTHDDHGEEIFDLKKIACRYLKTWFAVDVLSCLPIDLLLVIYAVCSTPDTTMAQEYDSNLELLQTTKLSRIFKSVRIFRLTKAVRVIKAFKAMHIVEKFLQYSDYNKTQFAKSMVLIVTIMHLLTCSWVFIGLWSGADSDFLHRLGLNGPHESWITNYQPWQDLSGSLSANLDIYVSGLLFVMQSFTTVGYGDVSPTNPIERFFAILLCFFGALLYGYIIAAVTAVVLSWNQMAVARHKRMDEITSFMRVKKFPTRLRTRIYTYFYKNLIHDNGELGTEYMKSHTVVLEGLSVPLRKEVTEFLLKCAKGELIASIPIFGQLDRSHMALLMPLFKRDTIPAGSDIITQGERNWEMFVLMGGKAVIRIPIYPNDANPDAEAVKAAKPTDDEELPLFYREEVMEPGACFGVMQMLGLGECKLSVVAKTDCDIWSMSGHDVHHAFKLYPTVVKQLKKTCGRMYTKLMQKANDNPHQQPSPGVNLYMETVARFHVSRNWKITEYESDWFTRNTKKRRAMRTLRIMGALKPNKGSTAADAVAVLAQQLEEVGLSEEMRTILTKKVAQKRAGAVTNTSGACVRSGGRFV